MRKLALSIKSHFLPQAASLGLHGILLLLCVISPFALIVKVGFIVFILLHSFATSFRSFNQAGQQGIVSLKTLADDLWLCEFSDGTEQKAKLLSDSYIAQKLIILNLKSAKRFFPYFIFLSPWNIGDENFKSLKIYLRFRT